MAIELASLHASPGDGTKVCLRVERDELRKSTVILSQRAAALLLLDLVATLSRGHEPLELILQRALHDHARA